MSRTGTIRIILPVLLILVGMVFGEQETVDKIAVVVGSEIILASELASQMQLVAFQTNRRPTTEDDIQKFKVEILEQMISDQLFLLEARKDTLISLRREEIEQALEEQIARVASNVGSEEEFLAALAQEGMTLRDLEKRYRGEIENQLLKQRFIQKKLHTVSVSRHEVEQFYNEFKDSIPKQRETIKLAHLLLEIKPSPEVEDSVQALAASLRQRVLDGADFATLSAQNSSLGAGANGGDLGYIARDDVVPEFARAAFQLNVGDISGVIRSQFGYHVIKCEGKRDDRLRLRHILLAVPPSAEDSAVILNLADSLLEKARSGADFAEMAKTFSSDDDTRAAGGELGWFLVQQMPSEFITAVSGWKTPGEYRGPVMSKFGVHLLKLLDHQSEKTLSLEDDFDRIKDLARQEKTGREVDKWIEELKKRTYIDYRMDS